MQELLLPELISAEGEDLGLFAGKIHHYMKIDSTNNLAKQFAEHGAEEGTVLVAEMQTHGRGKQGRSWYSKMSSGIYFSMILQPRIPVIKVPMLTLLSAVAVAETLQNALSAAIGSGSFALDIKWPNDVLLNGKKICGILSEMCIKGSEVSYVIVGIGINVNNQEFPPPLNRLATSLFLETGQTFSRVQLFRELLKVFAFWHDQLVEQNFNRICDRWRELSSFAEGKKISIDRDGERVPGITRGLSPDGALLFEQSNGTISKIFAGDIYEG